MISSFLDCFLSLSLSLFLSFLNRFRLALLRARYQPISLADPFHFVPRTRSHWWFVFALSFSIFLSFLCFWQISSKTLSGWNSLFLSPFGLAETGWHRLPTGFVGWYRVFLVPFFFFFCCYRVSAVVTSIEFGAGGAARRPLGHVTRTSANHRSSTESTCFFFVCFFFCLNLLFFYFVCHTEHAGCMVFIFLFFLFFLFLLLNGFHRFSCWCSTPSTVRFLPSLLGFPSS